MWAASGVVKIDAPRIRVLIVVLTGLPAGCPSAPGPVKSVSTNFRESYEEHNGTEFKWNLVQRGEDLTVGNLLSGRLRLYEIGLEEFFVLGSTRTNPHLPKVRHSAIPIAAAWPRLTLVRLS